jgi:D-alanyl-D-alanine carboxypeptidase
MPAAPDGSKNGSSSNAAFPSHYAITDLGADAAPAALQSSSVHMFGARRFALRPCVVALSFLVAFAFGRASAANQGALFPAGVTRNLNAAIVRIARQNNLPSVAVGVRVPGLGEYRFVTGYSNLRTHQARQFAQPFRIASITKAFTAAAVLQLIDSGKLRKTDVMARWFPDFPNARLITVDDLLRMRSGIAAPNDDEVLAEVYDQPLAPAPTLAQMMATSAKLRAQFIKPNTQGRYTDLNYNILGGIAQKVTGHDIGDLITTNIIRKLALRDTSYPAGANLPGGLRGYGWNPRTHRFDDKTAFNPALAGAAGAMISSIADLQTYIRALCRGGLFTAQTQRAMLDGQTLEGTHTRYGEGIISDGRICGHSGTVNGFNTDLYYVENADAAIVISVNRLDKNNKPQTTPVLAKVLTTVQTQLVGNNAARP